MGYINSGVKKINQIAEGLAGTAYWQKVMPGFKELQQEVGESVMRAGKVGNEINNASSISRAMAQMFMGLQGKTATEEEVKTLSSKISSKLHTEADIEKLFKENSHLFGGKDYSMQLNAVKKQAQYTNATPMGSYKSLSPLEKLKKVPKAYFTNPDKGIRDTRIKTAIGTYAGAAIGSRYLSGGSLTKDAYGRNDIAGIPFI